MGTSTNGKNFSFYLDLLMNMEEMNQYPFTKLIIEKQLTKEEYVALLRQLEQLDDLFQEQKEEGLLNFQSLLVQFVGMLNTKLEPLQTMQALKKEGFYPSLLDMLIKNHHKYMF